MTFDGPDRPVGGLAVRAPQGVELRPLGRSDLADAVALARQCRNLPPPHDVATLAPRLDAVLDSVDVVPFIASDGERAIGLGILELRRRLNFPTFEGAITDLFVVSEARGRGVGRALLQALIAEWRLRGGHRLQATALDGAAVGLYESAGMEEWMIGFALEPLRAIRPDATAGIAIRPPTEADFDAVTRLISQFGPQRTPGVERLDAVRRAYAAILRDVAAGHGFAAVAERDGFVAGVYAGEWQRPFWTDQTHAWLADLMVDEAHRGEGIGRALLSHAVNDAVATGASSMSLESGPRRSGAHALYRSTGFVETGRTWLLRRAA